MNHTEFDETPYLRPRWIRIGDRGLIMISRIVAVGRADAAAIRRLVGTTPMERIVDLTGKDKRLTVISLDSGHVVLTPLSIDAIERLLLRAM